MIVSSTAPMEHSCQTTPAKAAPRAPTTNTNQAAAKTQLIQSARAYRRQTQCAISQREWITRIVAASRDTSAGPLRGLLRLVPCVLLGITALAWSRMRAVLVSINTGMMLQLL